MINVRKRKEATVAGLGVAATLRVSSDCSFILLCEGLPGDGGQVWQMTIQQSKSLINKLALEVAKAESCNEPWKTIRAIGRR